MLHLCCTGEKATFEEGMGVRLVVGADDSELLDKLDQAAKKGGLENVRMENTPGSYSKCSSLFFQPYAHPNLLF